MMNRAQIATVITGARRESVPFSTSANFVAPYLSHTSRESVSCYVKTSKVVFSVCLVMSCLMRQDILSPLIPSPLPPEKPSVLPLLLMRALPSPLCPWRLKTGEVDFLESFRLQALEEASDSNTEPDQSNQCSARFLPSSGRSFKRSWFLRLYSSCSLWISLIRIPLQL
ncbi:hypothetical protein P9112_005844 [Eukaryota sp. TZLM1-RC]